jgi:hypothetical protein
VPTVTKESVVARVVFTAEGVDYTWGDVAAAAWLRGDWAAAERTAGLGLAALAELHSRREEIDSLELQEAAATFRYERDLLSGDEMVAWLRRWDLSSLEWSEWLGAGQARGRLSERSGELVAEHEPEPDDVQTAAAVEAICSGALERWALELAQRAAVSLAWGLRGGAPTPDAPPARGVLALSPREWEVAAAKVAPLDVEPDAERVDEHAIARELALHRLDWLAFDCRLLRLPEEPMAREAMLCARDDGWAFDRVAAAAHAPLEHLELVLEDAPEQLQSSLVGAREGELAGPFKSGDGYLVLVIDSKRAPDLIDSAIVARARRRALDRIVAGEVDARIRWHERG